MPGFAGASASRENGRHRREPVMPESASLHSASSVNGRASTQELPSGPPGSWPHGHASSSSESRLAVRSPIASCMAPAIVWTPAAPPLARWARSRLLRRNGRQRWRQAGASVVWSCRPADAPGRSFWRWVLVSGNTGLAGMASCLVAPALLGGRDPSECERHQCRGQGQQYRGQGERRGGGAQQLPAGAAQRFGGA